MRSLVVVPTYDEAENLALLAEAIFAQGPYDMLVVDDNSPDGTWKVVEALMDAYPGRVAGILRPGKAGLAGAYVEGFRYALAEQYDAIFQMDADFSHRPADLPRLGAELAGGADLVIGSRYVPGGQTRGWPRWRETLSRAGSQYAALLLGLPIRDLTGGFKGFRRRALERSRFGQTIARGFAFQIELTYRCHQAKYHIREIPIVFDQRRHGASKMNSAIVLEAIWLVLALRLGMVGDQPPTRPRLEARRGSRS
ncbi:MAG: polyprenol monophosphomannose synthase [Chloroflexi bacterium]|nr:polyprenol monophosphomannose synthase [Chloroflexota bacterium]